MKLSSLSLSSVPFSKKEGENISYSFPASFNTTIYLNVKKKSYIQIRHTHSDYLFLLYILCLSYSLFKTIKHYKINLYQKTYLKLDQNVKKTAKYILKVFSVLKCL